VVRIEDGGIVDGGVVGTHDPILTSALHPRRLFAASRKRAVLPALHTCLVCIVLDLGF
jgi:hypothetical protein